MWKKSRIKKITPEVRLKLSDNPLKFSEVRLKFSEDSMRLSEASSKESEAGLKESGAVLKESEAAMYESEASLKAGRGWKCWEVGFCELITTRKDSCASRGLGQSRF